MGGGGGVTGFLNDASIFFDEPREGDGTLPEDGEPATKWAVGAANSSGNAQIVNAHVLCAAP